MSGGAGVVVEVVDGGSTQTVVAVTAVSTVVVVGGSVVLVVVVDDVVAGSVVVVDVVGSATVALVVADTVGSVVAFGSDDVHAAVRVTTAKRAANVRTTQPPTRVLDGTGVGWLSRERGAGRRPSGLGSRLIPDRTGCSPVGCSLW